MKIAVPKKLISLFSRSISAAFWAALVVVVLLELWVVKGSFDIILSTKNTPAASPSRQVRINFSVYDQILKRLQSADSYQPQPVTTPNPFGSPPKSVTGQ